MLNEEAPHLFFDFELIVPYIQENNIMNESCYQRSSRLASFQFKLLAFLKLPIPALGIEVKKEFLMEIILFIILLSCLPYIVLVLR